MMTEDHAMQSNLLLGDEAVAQGALDAGIGGAFSYPGTPSTEIFEYIQQHRQATVAANWSANEKVAYEEALGMCYAGRRALVSMKHVGLNVASDPFMNSALTGVNAGLVVVVADDPGMHSSQNEQDSRYYSDFAQIPVLEPTNQQEAYLMTREAFDYSEEVGLPVMIRLVTRLAHSRATVLLPTITPPQLDSTDESGKDCLPLPDPNDWVLVPMNARRRFRHLLDLQDRLQSDSESSPHNSLVLAGSRGIITTGIAYNYVREALGNNDADSILKVCTYPMPIGLIRDLVDHCDEILVIEEGYPFVEERLNGVYGVPGKAIRGKRTGHLPLDGELTPDTVAEFLEVDRPMIQTPDADLARRPPQLCQGCPHSDSFRAIIDATSECDNPLLFSDIGCYTLAVLPPFRAVHSCVDMGSSIGMAHGASLTGRHPVICTIGDSTFAHSGMTPLLGAVQADANITVFILDNATVAMTGTQDSMACGETLDRIVQGLGVDPEHAHIIDPIARSHADNVAIVKKEIAHRGLSVIVPRRACVHVKRKDVPRQQTTPKNGVTGTSPTCSGCALHAHGQPTPLN